MKISYSKPTIFIKHLIIFGLLAGSAKSAVIAISPTDVTASSQIDDNTTLTFNRFDDRLVDGSGLSGGQHTNSPNATMWLSSGTGFGGIDPNPTVLFDFSSSFQVNSIHVWNYNENNSTKRGVNSVTIEYSLDNISFTPVAGITNFAQASGLNTYTGEAFNAFTPFTARYVRFDINTNHGDSSGFYGLSEVQFDGAAIPEPSSTFLLGLSALAIATRRKRSS